MIILTHPVTPPFKGRGQEWVQLRWIFVSTWALSKNWVIGGIYNQPQRTRDMEFKNQNRYLGI